MPLACIYELLYKSQQRSSVDNRQTTATKFHFNPIIAEVSTAIHSHCTATSATEVFWHSGALQIGLLLLLLLLLLLQRYSIALGQLWTVSQYMYVL